MIKRIWKLWLTISLALFVTISCLTFFQRITYVGTCGDIAELCAKNSSAKIIGWPPFYVFPQEAHDQYFSLLVFGINVVEVSVGGFFIAWFIDWQKMKRTMRVKE